MVVDVFSEVNMTLYVIYKKFKNEQVTILKLIEEGGYFIISSGNVR